MPNAPQTAQELVELTKKHNQAALPLEPLNLKYVIYARKSTDNSEQQVRSLTDQLTECRELATRNNLKVVDEILESESAKEPDTRPKFRKLLEDVKLGKVHGIISWHPDRLARNMKEAGEIIDLLDKGVIKSLQFVSFTFQNDTSGKTLLGITFVLSKQYSDSLSDNINRGIYRSIMEGKYIARIPHGYYRDDNFLLWPDEGNFLLIKKAFAMRLDNKSLEDIVTFLNKSGYRQYTKSGHQLYEFTYQRVSDLLKKKVYAGVLEHGEYVIALGDVYPFEPLVSVADFCKINRITTEDFAFRGITSKKTKQQTLLRGLLTCGHCNRPLTSAMTHKYNKDRTQKRIYYYYRCDNTSNSRCRKNTFRAYTLMDSIYELLDKHLFVTEESFSSYVAEMQRVTMEQTKYASSQLRSLQHKQRQVTEHISKIKKFLLAEKNAEVKAAFSSDLKEKQEELASLTVQVEEAKQLKEQPKQAFMDYQQFVELFGNIRSTLRKTTDLKAKDELLRDLFVNLTIKDKKMASYKLKEPFNTFVENGFFRFGGDGRNRTAV